MNACDLRLPVGRCVRVHQWFPCQGHHRHGSPVSLAAPVICAAPATHASPIGRERMNRPQRLRMVYARVVARTTRRCVAQADSSPPRGGFRAHHAERALACPWLPCVRPATTRSHMRQSTHTTTEQGRALPPLRAPAVPLVTHDPYFSTWSVTDSLAQEWPKHWTGYGRGMCGLVRVDGKAYRFLGLFPPELPAVEQLSVEVLPTRTIYRFRAGGIELVLAFITPALPHDLDLLSRPVTYVQVTARSVAGGAHAVAVYLDVSADWAVNTEEQVTWSRFALDGMQVLRIGSLEQPVLRKSGDNLRIDWGYVYLAVPLQDGPAARTVLTDFRSARESFATGGDLPAADDLRMPRLASDQWPVMACAFDLGRVGRGEAIRHVLLAYDELFAIEYLNRHLRP